jgi:pimeloyl-ACP methyl ester carboxylesterase
VSEQLNLPISRRHLLRGSAAFFALTSGAGLPHSARAAAPAARVHQIERLGARIHIEVEGLGPPVVLLHGGLGHMGWFDELLRFLVVQQRQVIRIDTRGMGRSSLGDRLSYAESEADVLAVLDKLDLPSVDLVGFSDGGITGYRLAARADGRIRRLITIGSRWSAQNGQTMWPEFERWSAANLSSGPFKFIVDDYMRLNPDRDFDRMLRLAVDMWKDDSPTGHPGAAGLGRIKGPVLVVVGDMDPFLAVSDALRARSMLARSQLLVVPGAGHPAYRERADVFNPALTRFLEIGQ